MTKQRNIWDIFYDKRDKWECHKTTIIAIDNKWRYITEVECIDWVFVEDNLDRAEETTNDWIDEAYEEWQHTVTSNDIKYFYRDEFRQVIEKHQPKSDVCNLVPLDTKKIADELQPLSFKDGDWYACTSISNVLSIIHKYGTIPQKKFNKKDIQYYIDTVEYWLTKDGSELWANIIRWFLAYNWLLEE